MSVLAIDTSEAWCSATLVANGAALGSMREKLGRGHAERLMPMIEELMAEAGCSLGDVTRLAVVTGPGTFTGLRIGLSVARGLGLALSKPVIGITGLSLVAGPVLERTGGTVHAVVDGRGGQAFHQAFEGFDSDGLPVPVSDAGCFDMDIIREKIAARPGHVAGSGATPAGSADAAFDGIDPVWLARVAERLDPAAFPPEPAYFRPPDAKKATPLFPVAV
ncbi:tRNA (adenosine(37)-N6)-threonylcarbamoyltransferase complex dimerization subunit type 1 TsaB [Gimibacter soli]|uniref:tRNA (Adenosine(37)-N6)-threonylcarbamoyltransferase complex dimerization subunit type 1 TsaB n=1 Tax=Gimibacter soli TaxID=3024400 RepID=A0AAE9XPZ7_9PROT|nr:tRNA (adenosine(37)-N6)-threonylcarbamoyltransferase complex dimerization subunit type 1 TsaB [Gimibacter soli]WCL54251.1 tRNA (adenosine(37)-N6)-threonylcarbamoyltransferase complex dimerization subunit type 1 TsaB [Gimibacter soli]